MDAFKQFSTDRPISVTIASVFVLFITAWSGIRALQALIDWEVLSRFNAYPAYIFVAGLAWFLLTKPHSDWRMVFNGVIWAGLSLAVRHAVPFRHLRDEGLRRQEASSPVLDWVYGSGGYRCPCGDLEKSGLAACHRSCPLVSRHCVRELALRFKPG